MYGQAEPRSPVLTYNLVYHTAKLHIFWLSPALHTIHFPRLHLHRYLLHLPCRSLLYHAVGCLSWQSSENTDKQCVLLSSQGLWTLVLHNLSTQRAIIREWYCVLDIIFFHRHIHVVLKSEPIIRLYPNVLYVLSTNDFIVLLDLHLFHIQAHHRWCVVLEFIGQKAMRLMMCTDLFTVLPQHERSVMHRHSLRTQYMCNIFNRPFLENGLSLTELL